MAKKPTKKTAAKKTAPKKDGGKSTSKGTETFTEAIKNHLREYTRKDPLFLQKLKNPKKNIDDCITYIINQVQKSGMNGFTDEEIFKMARHYYDEEDIKVGSPVASGSVVVNHHVELTEEEKEQLRKEAREKVIKEEMDKVRGKGKKKKSAPMTVVQGKEEPKSNSGEQASLF